MFEKILRWYDEIHGLKFVALRYFNAAGATEKYGEDHRIETHLIPNVLKVALGQKEHVEIYGTDYETPDGTCVRDYIHIVDLAQAHMLALGAKESAFYNLGTGGGTSVREVIATCERSPARRSRYREAAPARRSGAADRRFGQSEARARLAAQYRGDRQDRGERLGRGTCGIRTATGIEPRPGPGFEMSTAGGAGHGFDPVLRHWLGRSRIPGFGPRLLPWQSSVVR